MSGKPQLRIDYGHLRHNVEEIVAFCSNHDIAVTGIVKVFQGLPALVKAFVEGGCTSVGSSRISQLKRIREWDDTVKTMLIRIPMLSELEAVIAHADISLNSEWSTIENLNTLCKKNGTTHAVVLMFDLGDLREGFIDEGAFIEAAIRIEERLEYIDLAGIGTNIGCYGSIKPTAANLTRLADLARQIEARIGRQLEIVSGGATTTLPLLKEGRVPSGINHLRIGEAISLNRDLPEYWGVAFSELHDDIFTLVAEIVEIKEKPSQPVGEVFIDAFGRHLDYEDIGPRLRALLAVGRLDFGSHDQLIPLDPGIRIVGSSSDHLILDITDSGMAYRVGDTVAFHMYYESALYLTASADVEKVIQGE